MKKRISKLVLWVMAFLSLALILMSIVYYFYAYKKIEKEFGEFKTLNYQKEFVAENHFFEPVDEFPFFIFNIKEGGFVGFIPAGETKYVVHYTYDEKINKDIQLDKMNHSSVRPNRIATDGFIKLMNSRSLQEHQVHYYLLFLRNFFLPASLQTFIFSFLIFAFLEHRRSKLQQK